MPLMIHDISDIIVRGDSSGILLFFIIFPFWH